MLTSLENEMALVIKSFIDETGPKTAQHQNNVKWARSVLAKLDQVRVLSLDPSIRRSQAAQ